MPILMYHRIGPDQPELPELTRRLTVAPEDFREQMRWLHAQGYHALTQRQLFEALEHGRALPSKPILITFDDGYRNVLWNASPVIHRLGMHATAYVITDRISGSDSSFLTWKNLRLLEKRGFDIGSHTVSHRPLTSLDAAEARAELVRSRRVLERHLGHPVQWLAYPLGDVDDEVVALAREAGYVLAATTQPGEVQHARAPLELHRYEVLDTTGVDGLAALLAS